MATGSGICTSTARHDLPPGGLAQAVEKRTISIVAPSQQEAEIEENVEKSNIHAVSTGVSRTGARPRVPCL